MKVNIYYGGRGLIEDTTIYVMNKLTEVLSELRIEVVRYNLYEDKNGISMLPSTLKDADAVILAASVEWMGIGGLMQQFLDACWLYGDKEKISKLYMFPVVMASTYGERDAQFALIRAWEMLGGIPCDGLCAYVEDHVEFETNPEYALLIEKKAEMIYRTISHRTASFPNSSNAVKQTVLKTNMIDLTPQESEQLSKYVSDDTYVKKQKEDIEELAQLFKGMLESTNGREKTVENSLTDLEKNAMGSSLSSMERKKAENSLSGLEQRTAGNGLPGLGQKTAGNDLSGLEQKTAGNSLSGFEKKTEVFREEFLGEFRQSFHPMEDFSASYAIEITDMERTLVVEVNGIKLKCYYGQKEDASVLARTNKEIMQAIVKGKMTLQKAFMSGALTAKGNFKTLRSFDTIFRF